MQRKFAVALVVLFLTPCVFADESRPRDSSPGFNVPKIVKKFLAKFLPFDELLTGSKP